MKEKIIEKEIKKAQKKGIYNPKLKLGIVALILVIGTVIGISYAYYTGTANNTLTIKGTVSKKIMVRVEAGEHGTVESMKYATAQTDYNSAATFTLKPNEGYQYKNVTCKETNNSSTDVTSKVTSSYNKSNNTLTITPRTSKDVTCTVEFERVRTLEEIKTDIIKTAKSGTPNFSTGCPTNGDTTCSGVYKMTDYNDINNLNTKTGTSYYFRGKVDNYVKFGQGTTKNSPNSKTDLIWRIVRVNGDGSIRLVLDNDLGASDFNRPGTANKYAGYTYDNEQPCTNSSPCTGKDIATNNEESIGTTDHGGTNSTIKKKLEAWYYDNLKSYDSYITYGTYCNDTSYGSGSVNYGAYQRLQANSSSVTPQLTCPDPKARSGTQSSDDVDSNGYHTYGGVYKLKIGLLSADEIVLAGFKPTSSSPYPTTSNYLYYTGSYYFWSSSPVSSNTDRAYVYYGYLVNRSLSSYNVDTTSGVRPVINLKTDNLNATGEGTKENPFVIK